MSKVLSERLKKDDEQDLVIPGESFRLRFQKVSEPLVKPHFQAMLTPVALDDNTPMLAADSVEVEFLVVETPGTQIKGTYEEVDQQNMTPDIQVAERNDYDADIEEVLNEQAQNKPKEELKLPEILSDDKLTSATKNTKFVYPNPKHIKMSGGRFSDNFIASGKVTFEVDGWEKGKKYTDEDKKHVSWIVFSEHNTQSPILYYPFEENKEDEKGYIKEIDFSLLPLGKYRVEAIGKWGLWHAIKEKNRFNISIPGQSKKASDYAILDIESTADRLTNITSSEKASTVAPGENVTFSTGSLFNEPDSLTGLNWTISNAEGETMQDQTGAAAGNNTITLNFPKPGDNKVQEYTLKVTSGTGLTTERKISVDFLTRLGKVDLVDETLKDNQPARAGAKQIKIESGPHDGKQVALKPITFKVSDPDNLALDTKMSWILYKGYDYTYPIRVWFDQQPEFTFDFSTLPEGKYRMEAFGKTSEWHANFGMNRFGGTPTIGKYAKLDVESKVNVLENVKSEDFIKGEKSKKQETNWGVPVKFTADLLFDLGEDIAKLEWALKDAEGNSVMETETEAAKGQSSITFNFPQPEKAQEYTLTLSLNGVSKTQSFIVVPQAFVKSIQLISDADKFVYNQDKKLTFKVTGYSQKQANPTDLVTIKWIRVFFPGLHYEDYKNERLTFEPKNGQITKASFGTHSTDQVEIIENEGADLKIAAGIYEDPLKKDKYKKGLYFVEAYMNRPEGKKGTMDCYEVARNEPSAIAQVKKYATGTPLELTSQGFMRPSGEKFTFKVNNWMFGQSYNEDANVIWALVNKEETVVEKVFTQRGSSVELSVESLIMPDGEEKDYVLKAFVGEHTRGAKFNVRIGKAAIIDAFFADSSGKKITVCGQKDKVYFYMKTTGIEYEKVHATMWEYDYMWRGGDDYFTGTDTVVNEKGVVFQMLDISTVDYEKNFESGDNEVYPSLGFDLTTTVTMTNSWDTSLRRHFYKEEDDVLVISSENKAVDFDFVSPVDNRVLLKPVLYGEKVKVRVRITNKKGEEVYIYLVEMTGTPTLRLVTESSTAIKVNDEGFAEMEFIVPKEWEKNHTGKDADSRVFIPAISYDNVTPIYPDNIADATKTLHVVKIMPTEDEIKNLKIGSGVVYGDIELPKPAVTGPIQLTFEDLNNICPIPASGKSVVEGYLPYLNKYLTEYKINATPIRLAHFIGQSSIETGFWDLNEGFNYAASGLSIFENFQTTEGKQKAALWGRPEGDKTPVSHENQVKIANWAYGTGTKGSGLGNAPVAEADLGNENGEGYKYRGRGLAMVTGKSNYTAFQTWYNENRVKLGTPAEDFIGNPDRVLESEYAVLSAIYYFTQESVSGAADQGVTKEHSNKVSQIVNSGFKKQERYERTVQAYKVIFAKDWEMDSKNGWVNPLENMVLRGHYSVWDPERSVKSDNIVGRNSGKHDGLDIYAPPGTDTRAVLKGKVNEYRDDPAGYGLTIFIEALYDGKTHYFRYSHLSERLIPVGQDVNAGDVIGKTGLTGNAGTDPTKAHLHFEVYIDGKSASQRVNPISAIPEIARTLNVQPVDDGTQDGIQK